MSGSRLPWGLWRAQIMAILRLEMKKTFINRRGLWIYFLAFAPVLLYVFHSFVQSKHGRRVIWVKIPTFSPRCSSSSFSDWRSSSVAWGSS